MKIISLQIQSYSHLIVSIGATTYNMSVADFIAAHSEYWLQEDECGNPNLCTQIPIGTTLSAVFNDGQNNYNASSFDFVGGRPVGR